MKRRVYFPPLHTPKKEMARRGLARERERGGGGAPASAPTRRLGASSVCVRFGRVNMCVCGSATGHALHRASRSWDPYLTDCALRERLSSEKSLECGMISSAESRRFGRGRLITERASRRLPSRRAQAPARQRAPVVCVVLQTDSPPSRTHRRKPL